MAIDPGREKCGLAVSDGVAVVERCVVPTAQVTELVVALLSRYTLERIILGNRTGAEELRRRLASVAPGLPLILVAEEDTTLEARRRYFRDHPPRGWRRLLPQTFQLPPEPYDDYAAILLAERYFATFRGGASV